MGKSCVWACVCVCTHAPLVPNSVPRSKDGSRPVSSTKNSFKKSLGETERMNITKIRWRAFTLPRFRRHRYIYCGQITLTTHSVLGLLVLADKYNVPDLKECCSTYMSHHLVSRLRHFRSRSTQTRVLVVRRPWWQCGGASSVLHQLHPPYTPARQDKFH